MPRRRAGGSRVPAPVASGIASTAGLRTLLALGPAEQAQGLKTEVIIMDKSEWNLYSSVYDIYYGSYDVDIAHLDERWEERWASVLEVGCGSGRLLPFFSKKGV